MSGMEITGGVIMVVAVVGVVLNNKRLRACFVLWMLSNTLSAGVHLDAGMYTLAMRDVIFFGLAIHGLVCWSRRKNE